MLDANELVNNFFDLPQEAKIKVMRDTGLMDESEDVPYNAQEEEDWSAFFVRARELGKLDVLAEQVNFNHGVMIG